MAKAETDNRSLLVDNDHLSRREPRLLMRLVGLAVSLAAIAGAIYWASTL